MKASALGAVVAALACGSAHASVITYELTGTASYTLGGVAHSGLIDITGVGDTAGVVSQPRPGGKILELNGTATGLDAAPFAISISLTGVGAFDVVGTGYVFDLLNGTESFAGFGGAANTDFLYVRSALLSSYDLASALTPITVNWIDPGGSGVLTTGGQLQFASISNAQFSARVDRAAGPAGAAPEPATWAMMLLGFSGLGAALRTARRKASTAA